MNETIRLERFDDWVRLVLERPHVRNALDSNLIGDLHGALNDLEQDPSVRVLVLTGAGSAFSAGVDLKELRQAPKRTVERNLDELQPLRDLLKRLHTFPKPTVAAVNGPAIAGGCGLVLACDLAVASEKARFGFTEVRIGFVPALVGVLLLQACGPRKAQELLISGRIVNAREALSLGLVSYVVPHERLDGKCRELVEELVGNAPEAVRRTKELLRLSAHLPTGEAFELAYRFNVLSRTDPELKEGIEAFFQKRAPAWKKIRNSS